MIKRILVFVVTCVLLAVSAYMIYSVDPYQYFRKADRYFPEARMQLPGLAKHQDYDSIILGDSIANNFDRPLMKKYLPGIFLNLAMEGATTYEEHRLLDTALTTGRVRKVVWALHHVSLTDPTNTVRLDHAVPSYLYGANSFPKSVRYLASPANLIISLKLKFFPDSLEMVKSLDTYGNWHEKSLKLKTYSYEAPLVAYYEKLLVDGIVDRQGQWNRTRLDEMRTKNNEKLDIMKANIDQYILPAFEENPEVEFIIYLPPFSIVSYKYAETTGDLENIFAIRAYLAEKVLEHKNAKLYDFQGERKLILNLALYKDTMHYTQGVDVEILKCLAAADRYLVTNVAQIDGVNQALRQLVEAFTLRPEDAEVVEWLKRVP